MQKSNYRAKITKNDMTNGIRYTVILTIESDVSRIGYCALNTAELYDKQRVFLQK